MCSNTGKLLISSIQEWYHLRQVKSELRNVTKHRRVSTDKQRI